MIHGPTNKTLSLKLQKQLKALERSENHVAFGVMLDEIGFRINEPKKRRQRRIK